MAITCSDRRMYLTRLQLLVLLLTISTGGCSEDKGAPSPADSPSVKSANAEVNPTAELRTDQLAAVLLAQFPEYDECPRPDDPGSLRYAARGVDLNDDSKPEVVAIALGREACGSGGCTAFVLRDSGTGYQVVTRITSVSAPILVAADRSSAWHDLFVGVGGGGAESGMRVLRFNGNSYPDNASLAPRVPKNTQTTSVIVDDPATLAAAKQLVPTVCVDTPSATATESIGGLSIGTAARAAKKLLGPPKVISKSELWEADGLYHQTWTYPSAGAVVGLTAANAKGPWSIFTVTLKTPGKLTTRRGIGIGASRKNVLAAYGNAAQPYESLEQGQRTLIVGTEYEALLFSFDLHDRVVQIFLGATAE